VADQDAVNAAADRVRESAAASGNNNLAVITVDAGRRAVEVLWVGEVPAQVAAVAASEASKGVDVVFGPAAYTRAQMQEAIARAIAVKPPSGDSNSTQLTVARAEPCLDGSGIAVFLATAATGLPADTVPAAFAEALQDAAKPVPVLVTPGPAIQTQ
jgi:hypothetical protein